MSAVNPTLQWHPTSAKGANTGEKKRWVGRSQYGSWNQPASKIPFEAHLGTTLVDLGSSLVPILQKIYWKFEKVCEESAKNQLVNGYGATVGALNAESLKIIS